MNKEMTIRKGSPQRATAMQLVMTALWLIAGTSMMQAQPEVKGGWEQFGIQKADTIVKLNNTEIVAGNKSSIFYGDARKGFDVSLRFCCHTLGTEQVFLCKDGKGGEKYADLSIGYDNMQHHAFVEVKDEQGRLHRFIAGEETQKDQWYDVRATAQYDAAKGLTTLFFSVNGTKAQMNYPGKSLPYTVSRWVVGHGYPGGFPNSLQVLNGEVAQVKVSLTGIDRQEGQNPIFTDRFTADPACTVIGNLIYAYIGEDKAGVGGWFYMPHWVCYSSDDMIHWTDYGVVLRAADFPNANPNGAWAGQVVEYKGKYYYYVTLDDKRNGKHMIDVAVSDSPTGPFRPARKDGTPMITDDMTTDSHRANADIDPTVFIDDDGTPWMAWGNGDCYMVRLKKNMIELDGDIRKVPFRNYSEGPWLFKRGEYYYMVYAADAPGVQPEQIAYSYARNIEGPWIYGSLLTGPAKYGFTIHPSVNEFNGQWYFFYHDGSYMLNGEPGGDCRRQVCVERLYFNDDGTIRPIPLTLKGLADI